MQPPDLASAMRNHGCAGFPGEIDDPQAGGDATTPGDIRLPDIQGFSTCDVSETMVTELVLTSSEVYLTDDLPKAANSRLIDSVKSLCHTCE